MNTNKLTLTSLALVSGVVLGATSINQVHASDTTDQPETQTNQVKITIHAMGNDGTDLGTYQITGNKGDNYSFDAPVISGWKSSQKLEGTLVNDQIMTVTYDRVATATLAADATDQTTNQNQNDTNKETDQTDTNKDNDQTDTNSDSDKTDQGNKTDDQTNAENDGDVTLDDAIKTANSTISNLTEDQLKDNDIQTAKTNLETAIKSNDVATITVALNALNDAIDAYTKSQNNNGNDDNNSDSNKDDQTNDTNTDQTDNTDSETLDSNIKLAQSILDSVTDIDAKDVSVAGAKQLLEKAIAAKDNQAIIKATKDLEDTLDDYYNRRQTAISDGEKVIDAIDWNNVPLDGSLWQARLDFLNAISDGTIEDIDNAVAKIKSLAGMTGSNDDNQNGSQSMTSGTNGYVTPNTVLPQTTTSTTTTTTTTPNGTLPQTGDDMTESEVLAVLGAVSMLTLGYLEFKRHEETDFF